MSLIPNPLQSLHEHAQASFLPYGPLLHLVESYGQAQAEYAAIYKGAALMDSPHRGTLMLTGPDRLAFLNNLVTNNVKALQPGQGCYAYLLNTKGRIVADLVVLEGADRTLLDLDIRLAPEITAFLEKYHFGEKVSIQNLSESMGRLSLMGPQALALINRLTPEPLAQAPGLFQHQKRTLAGVEVEIFGQNLVAGLHLELLAPRAELPGLWMSFLEEAPAIEYGVSPAIPRDPAAIHLRTIGWAAFNTARIEAGSPLLGIDITDQQLPMETARWFARAVSVTKGCYLGQEIVARMHAHQSVARLLVGLRIASGKLPMAGTEIFAQNQAVGLVTSSCMSPLLGYGAIAMGYVKKAFSSPAQTLEVLAEGGRVEAQVVEMPFVGGSRG